MSENKPNQIEGTSEQPISIEQDASGQDPGSSKSISHSRRRFAKAGLLAPPILMSVASRPVLGTTGVNCFSNALSGNLSNPDPDHGLCETIAGVDWRDGNNWPLDVVYMGVPIEPDKERVDDTPPESCDDCTDNGAWSPNTCYGGTMFNAVFPSGSASTSMYRILCESENSDEAAAVEMILYALTDSTYALRPMQVQDLYAGKDSIYADFLSHFGGMGGYLLHTLSA